MEKGIPVIIAETSLLIEEKKEIHSIREDLYFIFSLATDYRAIMAFLWVLQIKNLGLIIILIEEISCGMVK